MKPAKGAKSKALPPKASEERPSNGTAEEAATGGSSNEGTSDEEATGERSDAEWGAHLMSLAEEATDEAKLKRAVTVVKKMINHSALTFFGPRNARLGYAMKALIECTKE